MTGYKNPPRRRTAEIQLLNVNVKLRPLVLKYAAGMSWQAIGAEIGVSGAIVYRAVVKGILPKKPAYLRALGLPVTLLAPVCPSCGIVHVSKRCPAKRATPGKPRTSYKSLFRFMWAAWLGRNHLTR